MTNEKARVDCANSPAGKDRNPTDQEETQTMSILTDSAVARQSQGPRAPRPRYVQCAQGAELRAAREAAGMTIEQAARRIVTVWNLRNPNRNHGRAADDFSGRDLQTAASKMRLIARLERTSQDAYDRAEAERERRDLDPEYCKTVRTGACRPWPSLFVEPLAAITLGHVDATVDELRDALGIVQAASEESRAEATRADLRERAASIARLVWNHADDGKFLDQALFQELRGPESYRDGRIDGAAGYFVRSLLAELAHELRVTFPNRPAMESNWEAMTGSPFSVTSRAPSARSGGAVVITPPKGAAVALSAAQARELSHAILNAAIAVERGGRAVVAKAKTAAARDIRRAVDVDEALRERDR